VMMKVSVGIVFPRLVSTHCAAFTREDRGPSDGRKAFAKQPFDKHFPANKASRKRAVTLAS
jgi:hypothetical protein